ncbi:MAG: nitroreductase family protein [Lachnospiraceae bacterium]|nr:nitroreductase family protein [Lachnospiraceae bacterium]
MELLEGIKTRRSIRKFKEDKVPEEVIRSLVETARFAPTWKNSQTARYIAVVDPELKAKAADEGTTFEPNKAIIKGAPVLIVQTTVDKRAGYERDGSFSTSKETHWQSYDAGLCGEAFCLAAHEAGLGTVIMGIFDEAKIIQVLDVPEGQSVSALIALGYPAEEPQAPKRKEVDDLLTIR